MCRNIRTLYNLDPPATELEIREAALQYVRKVSGYRSPSVANEAVFAAAVAEVSAATERLLAGLVTMRRRGIGNSRRRVRVRGRRRATRRGAAP